MLVFEMLQLKLKIYLIVKKLLSTNIGRYIHISIKIIIKINVFL